jgi:hypothetical protein
MVRVRVRFRVRFRVRDRVGFSDICYLFPRYTPKRWLGLGLGLGLGLVTFVTFSPGIYLRDG